MSIRVSVIGASGYMGGEALRYLVRHPDVQITHVTSETYAGQPIYSLHKFLKGRCDLLCEKLNIAAVASDSDVVFLGLPHGASAKTAAAFLNKDVKVIDLSADFRLKDLAAYTRWYGKHPVPKLLKEAVYGLPERYRDDIRSARLIANPGCYATTSILAGLPLAAKGLIGPGTVIIDAKSGVSGAGRKVEPMYLFSEADESMQAYGLKGHRHHPEIVQEWSRAAREQKGSGLRAQKHPWGLGPEASLIFVPHLVPMNRGIFATLYFPLARRLSAEALREIYLDYYQREPFVSVLNAFESPEVKAVTYTNACHISVGLDPSGKRAVVLAALDNLVKGGSGQAVQNMNLMFGLDETTALL